MLLSEYAIIPDVFDAAAYKHELLADLHLQNLKEVLLSEGVVRDLYNGTWSGAIDSQRYQYHRRGLELLRKLRNQNRLITCEGATSAEPSTDVEWCTEALASHRSTALTGIFAMSDTAASFSDACDLEMIAVVGQLNKAKWWKGRTGSVRPKRTTPDYATHLSRILSCSNSVMFIDPHLDPGKRNYREFVRLLPEMVRRGKRPTIEIHRVCYEGRNRHIVSNGEWEQRFSDELSAPLAADMLRATIFIWDDFHDRYLISNLMGIQLSNGFDLGSNPNELTTWTRLSRCVQDDVQREFDPASGIHRCHHHFSLP